MLTYLWSTFLHIPVVYSYYFVRIVVNSIFFIFNFNFTLCGSCIIQEKFKFFDYCGVNNDHPLNFIVSVKPSVVLIKNILICVWISSSKWEGPINGFTWLLQTSVFLVYTYNYCRNKYLKFWLLWVLQEVFHLPTCLGSHAYYTS